MTSSKENFLEVATLTKPHGIKGELKLRLHNEDSTSLQSVSFVVLESPKQKATKYSLENVRGEGQELIIALAGINNREQAEQLRSHKVYLHRDSLGALNDDEYFLIDLVGATVLYQKDVIGVVDSVRPDPSVDTLVIKGDSKTLEFPLVNHWVDDIDIKGKRIILNSLDGLIHDS